MRQLKQVNADMKKVISGINMTDRKSFKLNVKYAKGEIDHDVLIATLQEMQKYREQLFAKMVKLEKELDALGYEANIRL